MKRVYDPPDAGDGYRVLIDGLWPRGLSKKSARLDEWLRDLAPSAHLRKWFDHKVDRFPEFSRRYRSELASAEKVAHLKRLKDLAKSRTVTILFGAREANFNNAAVVMELLSGK